MIMNWLIKFSLILVVVSLVTFIAVRTIDKDNDLINNLIDNDKKVDNINEQLGLMMKFIEGLQSQLGNEVDALAKLEKTNFKESIDILNKLKVKVN